MDRIGPGSGSLLLNKIGLSAVGCDDANVMRIVSFGEQCAIGLRHLLDLARIEDFPIFIFGVY